MTRIKKHEVTLAEAMALTGYTKQNLQKLIDAGFLRRKERATFELGELFSAVMTHLRRDRARKTASPAMVRLLEAKTQAVNISNAKATRELISFKEHTEIVDLLLGSLRAELDSYPAELARGDKGLRQRAEDLMHSKLKRTCDKWNQLAKESESSELETDDDEPTNTERTARL